MADPAQPAAAQGQQPKDAVNYRQGGDVCHVCAHYVAGGEGAESGTCKLVEGAIAGHDVCDLFTRKAAASDQDTPAATPDALAMPPEARDLQRRGMISDKAMLGLRGRDY